MQPRRKYLEVVICSVTIMLALFFLTGAVSTQTSNVSGDNTESFRNVACSSDGNIVYVVDVEKVYKSEDGGSNWAVVLQKNP
jgi:hypothetical protein